MTEFQIIYFHPNPLIEWGIPWAFLIGSQSDHRIIASGLRFTPTTCGRASAAALAKACWRSFKTNGDFQALGPHFSRGRWMGIPERFAASPEAYLKMMVHP